MKELQMPPAIKGKFNLSLTHSNYQSLLNKADTLVCNEDNLEEVKEFLNNIRAGAKETERVHKEGKAEAWKVCTEWDSAKRVFISMWQELENKIQPKYAKVCRDIEERKVSQERERARVAAIRSGIDNNLIKFSSQIASCSTSKELVSVERMINLEKTRKDNYEEFFDLAVSKFSELNSQLAVQKEKIKELERLEELEKKEKDETLILEIKEKKDEIKDIIDESKISIQEKAIDTSLNVVDLAEEVFAEVKPRRSVWVWEAKNLKETLKKMPDWVELTTNDEKINDYLKAKKSEGIHGEDFEFAGIRFYLKKTY